MIRFSPLCFPNLVSSTENVLSVKIRKPSIQARVMEEAAHCLLVRPEDGPAAAGVSCAAPPEDLRAGPPRNLASSRGSPGCATTAQGRASRSQRERRPRSNLRAVSDVGARHPAPPLAHPARARAPAERGPEGRGVPGHRGRGGGALQGPPEEAAGAADGRGTGPGRLRAGLPRGRSAPSSRGAAGGDPGAPLPPASSGPEG